MNLLEKIESDLASEDLSTRLDALYFAGCLFEKQRGLSDSNWPEEVTSYEIVEDGTTRLKKNLRSSILTMSKKDPIYASSAVFVLGKAYDNDLKGFFIDVLKANVDGDHRIIYQVLIALSNLGENVFPFGIVSEFDEEENRIAARAYLKHEKGS